MEEGPVLIHVWTVDPQSESACVDKLEQLFQHQISADPGFVAARILESQDRSSLAAVIEMKSVEDRKRIEAEPDVRETLDHLHGAASLVVRLYHQIGAYGT